MKTLVCSCARSLALPILWFSLLCAPLFGQHYKITDLGTLPGGTYSVATAINSWGQVTGYADGPPTSHAIRWTKQDGMQDLGTLFVGGPSWAAAINDLGHVTGGSWIDDSDNGAFLWTFEEGMQEIVPVDDGPGGLAINDLGEIAGATTVEPTQPFVYTKNGGEVNLNSVLGGLGGTASGVNDLRQVVGYFNTEGGSFQAYRWNPRSGAKDLGEGFANAINFSGDVVGSTGDTGHAFLWTETAGRRDLGTLSGDSVSSAAAINIFSQVVGTSGTRAFFWSAQKGMLDLNTLIDAGSGWSLESATGINIFGQIVGNGVVNGQNHGFLLTVDIR